VAGFELTLKDEGGEVEFLFWQAEGGAKENLGRPAPGQGHEAHAFFQIALAGQEVERCLDKGLRIQGDQVGLVLVDTLVVSGIDSAGFLRFERKTGLTSLEELDLSGCEQFGGDLARLANLAFLQTRLTSLGSGTSES
jgi:hypothetical protein